MTPVGRLTALAVCLIGVGGLGGFAEGQSQAPASNNPWRLSQNPALPWRGTPRADIADHRNGAAAGGEAVFSDPRWAGRAIAIELRDFHRLGARSAEDYAASLKLACLKFGGVDCDRGREMASLAMEMGGTPTDDLALFNADHHPTGALFTRGLIALAKASTGVEPSLETLGAAFEAVEFDGLDQSEAGFRRWKTSTRPELAMDVDQFARRLQDEGVAGIVPTWQLLRTGSDWRGCGAPFELPPGDVQANIIPTLKLIRRSIAPVVGPMEAKSAYRSVWLNICAGGAEKSAHRDFSAVDLTPIKPLTRNGLMAKLCPIYIRDGEAEKMGLGFYAGVRFHVDTWKRRSWASESDRPYSPCAADGSVNPPLPPLPDPNPLPPRPPSR